MVNEPSVFEPLKFYCIVKVHFGDFKNWLLQVVAIVERLLFMEVPLYLVHFVFHSVSHKCYRLFHKISPKQKKNIYNCTALFDVVV